MKTINFELSKKLNDLGLLDNIETEFVYDINISVLPKWVANNKDIKTLTLEEAIEFIGKEMCQMELLYPNAGKWNLQTVLNGPNFQGYLIEVFEKFIEYLLDNNLLGTK